jgi:hypothetical protein
VARAALWQAGWPVGAEGVAEERAARRSLPQGRYWVGLFGVFAVLSGVMLVLVVVRDRPGEGAGPALALFVVTASVTVSMSRVTMYATPDALVVRNLVWKRHIGWDRIVGFRVKPYRFSRHYAASVVAGTEAGLEIRMWASMTRSKRRAAEIGAAIEALAEERGIPATIDPAALRCRWFSRSIPHR